MIDQFDRLRRRNAFVEQYKKENIFADGLEEFDDARCVARSSLLASRVLSGVFGPLFRPQGDGRRVAQGVQGVREPRLYHIRASLCPTLLCARSFFFVCDPPSGL